MLQTKRYALTFSLSLLFSSYQANANIVTKIKNYLNQSADSLFADSSARESGSAIDAGKNNTFGAVDSQNYCAEEEISRSFSALPENLKTDLINILRNNAYPSLEDGLINCVEQYAYKKALSKLKNTNNAEGIAILMASAARMQMKKNPNNRNLNKFVTQNLEEEINNVLNNSLNKHNRQPAYNPEYTRNATIAIEKNNSSQAAE